ncbi:MAG: hypothetical protein M0Z77_11565 [Thermoplasmatales archaeon]|jgi:hypothetical protein|nr:hypothetical protein [Candidatus Thermoplasmatota archaeon]MCL6002896.1 hypothetical protein [Candidatus Thermoplasmatota archaeon]MDA8056266.1 hypothetical protein [Thermoplasmatales archaeon]
MTRAKLTTVMVFLAIILFAWGWTIVLTARAEFLAGLYFRNTMGTLYWSIYLSIAVSAMLISYTIVAIRSLRRDQRDFKLIPGTISLWITWLLGAFISSLPYHMPSVPVNGSPLPEPGFVVISWAVLVTLNLLISLVLLLIGSNSNQRQNNIASV